MAENGAGSDFWAGNWAVATAGAKSYIGKVEGVSEAGDAMVLNPAYELIILNIPTQTPQGIALQKMINCVPVGAASNDVRMHLRPTDIMYINELVEADQAEYKKLIEGARQVAISARASKAGIQLVSSLPKSPGRA